VEPRKLGLDAFLLSSRSPVSRETICVGRALINRQQECRAGGIQKQTRFVGRTMFHVKRRHDTGGFHVKQPEKLFFTKKISGPTGSQGVNGRVSVYGFTNTSDPHHHLLAFW